MNRTPGFSPALESGLSWWHMRLPAAAPVRRSFSEGGLAKDGLACALGAQSAWLCHLQARGWGFPAPLWSLESAVGLPAFGKAAALQHWASPIPPSAWAERLCITQARGCLPAVALAKAGGTGKAEEGYLDPEPGWSARPTPINPPLHSGLTSVLPKGCTPI